MGVEGLIVEVLGDGAECWDAVVVVEEEEEGRSYSCSHRLGSGIGGDGLLYID